MEPAGHAKKLLEEYNAGKRYFTELDLNNESFDGQQLEGIIFEHCFLYSSFRNANLRYSKFINSNIKTCDFSGADLTGAHFEEVSVEAAVFKDARTEGLVFINNWCYGQLLTQTDFEWFKNE